MAKQNRDIPEIIPVITLLATLFFGADHGYNIAITLIITANIYKLRSLKTLTTQKNEHLR